MPEPRFESTITKPLDTRELLNSVDLPLLKSLYSEMLDRAKIDPEKRNDVPKENIIFRDYHDTPHPPNGQFDVEQNTIYINSEYIYNQPTELRILVFISTLIHEVTHSVSRYEGWRTGLSNQNMFQRLNEGICESITREILNQYLRAIGDTRDCDKINEFLAYKKETQFVQQFITVLAKELNSSENAIWESLKNAYLNGALLNHDPHKDIFQGTILENLQFNKLEAILASLETGSTITKNDLSKNEIALLHHYREDEVAMKPEEINDETKIYIGPISADIIPRMHNLECAYTEYPNDRIIWTIEIGNETIQQLQEKMVATDSYFISSDVKRIIDICADFTKEPKRKLKLIKLRVRDLDFNQQTTIKGMLLKAQAIGLKLCPIEVALQLGLLDHQPLNTRIQVPISTTSSKKSINGFILSLRNDPYFGESLATLTNEAEVKLHDEFIFCID